MIGKIHDKEENHLEKVEKTYRLRKSIRKKKAMGKKKEK